LKARHKLWQTDAERLPDDIGFAQIGDLAALVDLRIKLFADIHFGQRLHASHFQSFRHLTSWVPFDHETSWGHN
jgi:hypothetical protein